MKWNFFTMILLLLILMQVNIYAQLKNNTNTKKNISLLKNEDQKMFDYINLSDQQKDQIQTIRTNRKANLKAFKDIPISQNAILLNMATAQDSINNLLSPVQKVKMRKFEMIESYTEPLKQKVNLSQDQENNIGTVCELYYDKQQALIGNTSLSQEDIKQQIGKLNNETSNKITRLLTVEQKKQLETQKEK